MIESTFSDTEFTKKCATCGKTFKTTSRVQAYCSKECRPSNVKNQPRRYEFKIGNDMRKCEECRTVYKAMSKLQKFCSLNCKNIHYKNNKNDK